MTVDEDYLVMTPETPLMEIYKNYTFQNEDKNRCQVEGKLIFSAPIPKDLIVQPDTWAGLIPNAGLAVFNVR